jgi:hypothetical protein
MKKVQECEALIFQIQSHPKYLVHLYKNYQMHPMKHYGNIKLSFIQLFYILQEECNLDYFLTGQLM